MSRGEAWRTLGIEPTDNAGAIRRAYADRLRAIEADADPQVFMRLRDARDAALATRLAPVEDEADDAAPAIDDDDWDAWADVPDDRLDDAPDDVGRTVATLDPDIDGWSGASSDTPLLRRSPPRPPHRREPILDVGTPDTAASGDAAAWGEDSTSETQSVEPRVELHAKVPTASDLLADLLDGDLAVPLRADERAAAGAYLAAVAEEAALATIERHAAIDGWVAELLARTTPRSDPLIAPAGRLFAWEGRANDLALSPALDHLVARQKMLNFLDAVCKPGHALHRGWNALSLEPGVGFWRRNFANRAAGLRLLTVVRREFPSIEHDHLDAGRIALWEGRVTPSLSVPTAKRLRRALTIGGVAVVAAFKIVAASSHHPPPAVEPGTAVPSRAADIER